MTADDQAGGWTNGLIGVAIFSASLPATRVAVGDFDALFLTAARAAIAGLVAIALIAAFTRRRPRRSDIGSLFIVSGGVVLGFPLLTALALERITAAHSTVFIGLLPLSTALFGVLRAGDRPRPAFWAFACAGSALVGGYALLHGGDGDGSWTGDLLMLGAITACGLGYAEGGMLARRLGGWQVICWALVPALPLTIPLAIALSPDSWTGIGAPAWLALAYVSLFSMLIGFIFWYRGLAQGGVAAIGQLQLLQPFLSLVLAAVLLGEQVDLAMVLGCVGVVACVAGAKRTATRTLPVR